MGILAESAAADLAGIWDSISENDFTVAQNSGAAASAKYSDLENLLYPIYRAQAITDFALSADTGSVAMLNRAIAEDPGHPFSVALTRLVASIAVYDSAIYEEFIEILESAVRNRSIDEWIKREYQHILFDYYRERRGDSKRYLDLHEELNIISDWEILGPYSNISGSGFRKDFVEIASDSGQMFSNYEPGMNNWPLTPYVPALQSMSLDVRLSDLFSEIDYSSIYASTIINVEDAGQHTLVFGRNGAIEVWLDGEKILENGDYSRGDNLFYVERELKQGPSELIVKMSNLEGPSSFSAAFFPTTESLSSGSPLYADLFPGETFVNPLIHSICEIIDQEGENPEGYMLLTLTLLEKGLNEEAQQVLERLKSIGPDSMVMRWLEAQYHRAERDYSEFERIMLNLAEANTFFAPAKIYALRNFIAEGRIGKTRTFLEEIGSYDAEWYFYLESDMRHQLVEGNVEQAFERFSDLNRLFPNTSDQYLTMLNFNSELSISQIERYVETLYSHDTFSAALFWDIAVSLRTDDTNRASETLLTYLTHYPHDEAQWLRYLELLYDIPGITFMEIRDITFDLSLTFPLSHNLLSMERYLSHSLYRDMKSFYDENYSAFLQNPSAHQDFKRDMDREERNYKSALTKLVSFFPYDFAARDDLRELNRQSRFADQLTAIDSYFLIDDFLESGFNAESADALVVYDDRKEVFFGDGASSVRAHYVLQVLTTEGVEDNRYQYLEFHPVFGNGELREAYILKQDGSRIFANRSGRTLAFPGLSVGDFIVVRYAVNSYVPGEINDELYTSAVLQSRYPIYQSQFQLIYPEAYDLTYRYNNVSEEDVSRRIESFIEGFEAVTFTVSRQEALSSGVLSPHWRDRYAWIDISSISDWSEIISWYEDLYHGQTIVTPQIMEATEKITRGMDNRSEKIKAIYDFVSGGIEYEDLSFLYSNYVPQTAGSVLDEGYGDCKDQSVLLIAMLKSAGISSYIALNTPSYTGSNSYLPSPRFTHAIVVVPEDDGFLYLDPTLRYYTWDELPAGMVGSYILHITDGGEFAKIEADFRQQNSFYMLELNDVANSPTVRASIVYQGAQAGIIRSLYSGLNEDQQRERFSILGNSWMPGFDLSTLSMENIDELQDDPRVNFEGALANRLEDAGNGIYRINLPIADAISNTVNPWLGIEPGENDLTIDVPAFATPHTQVMVVHLPQGYSPVSIPDDLYTEFNDSYARYQYEENDGIVILTREIFIPNQLIAKDKIEEFQDFIYQAVIREQRGLYIRQDQRSRQLPSAF